MRYSLRTTSAAILSACLFFPAPVRAYDLHVSSRLWAEGYAVRAPGGEELGRRRFVEDLQLSAWNLLPGSGDVYYRGPRLSVHVALRLDADAQVGNAESNPGSEMSYVPGVTPLSFSALYALIQVDDLWDGALDLRGGRDLRVDTLGFFAFDGATVGVDLPVGAGLDVYAGYEVRGGHVLGYDALELDGTDAGGRRDISATRYSDRTDLDPRLAVGLELEINPRRWIDVGLGYRAVGVTGDIADERLGGRLAIGRRPVQSVFSMVYSPLLDVLSEADAEVAITPFEAVSAVLEYHRYRPIFEADSIFNVFDLTEQNDLGGRLELRIGQSFAAALWGYARLADGSGGPEGTREDATVSGYGGGLGMDHRGVSHGLSLRGSALREWGEDRLGVELGGRKGFLRGDRLWLGVRLSVWRIDDAFSERLTGNLAGYVISGRFRLAEGAQVLGEVEQYVGLGAASRTTMMVLLQLDLWR